MEGPFFLVERSSAPYYAMTILNRRSIDNFTQHIQPDMTFEIQEKCAHSPLTHASPSSQALPLPLDCLAHCSIFPSSPPPVLLALVSYLFFQVHDDVIGVWFYEQPEAVQAADALNKSHPTPSTLTLRTLHPSPSLSSPFPPLLPPPPSQSCAEPPEFLLPSSPSHSCPPPNPLPFHLQTLPIQTQTHFLPLPLLLSLPPPHPSQASPPHHPHPAGQAAPPEGATPPNPAAARGRGRGRCEGVGEEAGRVHGGVS